MSYFVASNAFLVGNSRAPSFPFSDLIMSTTFDYCRAHWIASFDSWAPTFLKSDWSILVLVLRFVDWMRPRIDFKCIDDSVVSIVRANSHKPICGAWFHSLLSVWCVWIIFFQKCLPQKFRPSFVSVLCIVTSVLNSISYPLWLVQFDRLRLIQIHHYEFGQNISIEIVK